MRNVFAILLLFHVFSSETLAQHRQKFGVTLGANYSKFRGMNVEGVTYDYGLGNVVGLSFEYYLNKNLSIKGNLFYDYKRGKGRAPMAEFNDPFDPALAGYRDIDIQFKYYYITLPVLLKYEFKNCRGFFINGGPFFGFLLDSEGLLETRGGSPSQSYSESTYDYNNKFDFGFTTGLGKSFKLNAKNNLVLEFRNNYGLFQTNKNNTFNGNVVRSNSYNLLLGWTIDM